MHANELTRYFFLIGGQPVIFEISKQLPPPVIVPVKPGAGSDPTLHIRCPFPVPRQAEHTVNVAGNDRAVPAAVARILGRIAKGEREVLLRSEAIDKLRLHLPELLARLHRNHDRKVTAKGAAYTVGTVAVEAE